MATGAAAARRSFETDLRLALHTAGTADTVKTNQAKDSIFAKWAAFCHELGHTSTLRLVQSKEDKLCYMLVFGLRHRRRKGLTGQPVRADTVADALAAVGQGMANLGAGDPRKAYPGARENHPLLTAFLRALANDDDPATRACPVNLTIIEALFTTLDVDHPRWGSFNAHVIDIILVAFFWLLRPAEYLEGSGDTRSEAFEFQDVEFNIENRYYHAPTAPLNDERIILRMSHSHLTFSDQKNAVRGEKIGHQANDHPVLCPVKALARIARRLHAWGAPPDTPLYRHYNQADKTWHSIKPQHVTNALRHAAEAVKDVTGIEPSLISARSLRPGGATALLLAGVSTDHIGLLGRWKSDAMFRYLRIQAATQRANFSQRMLDHGRYTFAPGTYGQADALPTEAPATMRDVLGHDELYA